jgi:hypothetical protein
MDRAAKSSSTCVFFHFHEIQLSAHDAQQPNLLAKDGTAALSAMAFSKSGEHFAYGISLSVSSFSRPQS